MACGCANVGANWQRLTLMRDLSRARASGGCSPPGCLLRVARTPGVSDLSTCGFVIRLYASPALAPTNYDADTFGGVAGSSVFSHNRQSLPLLGKRCAATLREGPMHRRVRLSLCAFIAKVATRGGRASRAGASSICRVPPLGQAACRGPVACDGGCGQ